MNFHRRAGAPLLAVSCLLGPGPGAVAGQSVEVLPVPVLSGEAEDRLRLLQLFGDAPTDGFVLRTSASLLPAREVPTGAWALDVLAPRVRTVWNSDLPFSMNDGGLWAGRGLNVALAGGARFAMGRLRVTVAPELYHEQNREFQTIVYPPTRVPARSPWANPFHPLPESLDLPVRFGDAPITEITPGQSSIAFDAGSMTLSAGTENTWWGPGIRNGILLSNQAAGFPHVSIASASPWETQIGRVEFRWMLGRLDESEWFNDDPADDHRSLSALGVTLRPAFDDGLTLGIARVVYAPVGDGDHLASAAFDALRDVGRPDAVLSDTTVAPGPDQIFALFGRWVFPGAGFEAYAEWARFEQPASPRDFLEFPQHSQAYTMGLQWARRDAGGSMLRLQAELSNLEPSATWRHRSVFSSYSSQVVPHGYTHRGQVLGAALGPGASGQWLAVDRFSARRWSAGAFVGRARLDAAAHFRDVVPFHKREDVLLWWGVRGGADARGWSVHAELSQGVRLNYLFQSYKPDPLNGGRAEGVDVANTSIVLTLGRSVAR